MIVGSVVLRLSSFDKCPGWIRRAFGGYVPRWPESEFALAAGGYVETDCTLIIRILMVSGWPRSSGVEG
jgi:hypothetical protein